MDFRIEQVFAAPPDAVVAGLCDPVYLALMGELPDVSSPRVRSQQRDGTTLRQVLEYQFKGNLPSVVTRVIDPARLSWLEHDEIDLVARRCTYRMEPIHYQRFFTCTGSWTVTANGGDGSRRTIIGTLKVSSPVPFVGGKVEKAIVSGLQDRLAVEPRVFAGWYRQSK